MVEVGRRPWVVLPWRDGDGGGGSHVVVPGMMADLDGGGQSFCGGFQLRLTKEEDGDG